MSEASHTTHSLKDTQYWLSHPNQFHELMANRRRDATHHVFKPKIVEKPPPPPQVKEEPREVKDEPQAVDNYVQDTPGPWSTPM